MTPFGIRKRLKTLIGRESDGSRKSGAPPRKERAKVELAVLDSEGEEQVVTGSAMDSLVYISGNMARPIGTGCSDSTCATCRVEVLEGEDNLNAQQAAERATLKANGHSEDLRLGCQTRLQEGTARVRAFEFIEL